MADDRFELYDLRVEVVAPEGATILAMRRPGDCFEVRGEMLHFPPGQGFSIYSLAALLPLLPAKQRATDAERLDDQRRRGRVPRPALPDALPHHAAGQAQLQPRRDHRGAVAGPAMIETVELAPGYRIPRIVRGGWQLAGGHGEVDRERAVRDIAAFVDAGLNTFDCADIYTGVEAI